MEDFDFYKSVTISVIDSTIFLSYVITCIILIFKVKIILDNNAYINMIVFALGFLAGAVSWMVEAINTHNTIYNWVDFFDFIIEDFIVLNIYAFIFEMHSVYCFLSSNSMKENEILQQRSRSFKNYSFIFAFITIIAGNGLLQYEKYLIFVGDNSQNYVLMIVIWTLFIIRGIQDSIMLYLFIKMFAFFFKLKKMKLSKEGKQFESHQKFNTILTMIIILIQIISIISRSIFPLSAYDIFETSQIYLDFEEFCQIYYSFADIITANGILILFYNVGHPNNIQKHKDATPINNRILQTQNNKDQITLDTDDVIGLLHRKSGGSLSIKKSKDKGPFRFNKHRQENDLDETHQSSSINEEMKLKRSNTDVPKIVLLKQISNNSHSRDQRGSMKSHFQQFLIEQAMSNEHLQSFDNDKQHAQSYNK